jgi:hypothetical protein
MKTVTRIVVVAAVAAIAWAAVGEAAERGHKWCAPTGGWIGANDTFGIEYLVTVQRMGGGCFSVTSDSIETVLPWEVGTPWRGMIKKIDRHTFTVEMVAYAGPSQLSNPKSGVPDIAGIRGLLTMLDCDHFQIEFGEVGLYAWGQTPFEDDPLATLPPSIAHYKRVPFDCENANSDD